MQENRITKQYIANEFVFIFTCNKVL